MSLSYITFMNNECLVLSLELQVSLICNSANQLLGHLYIVIIILY